MEYRLAHNAKFAKPPTDPEDAHFPSPNRNLNELLTYTVQREVTKALSLSFNKVRIISEDSHLSRRAIGAYVHVALHLDGTLEVLFNESALPFYVFDKIRRVEDEGPAVVDRKRLGAALATAQAITEVGPHQFRRYAHVFAGFRKHFREPDDPTSVELRNAPDEIRIKHREFPRQPLGRHPIVVLEKRISELNDGGGD